MHRMRRYTALFRLIPLLLLSLATTASAATSTFAAAAPAGTLTYDVLREGERIGIHTMSFERMGEELTVRTETRVDFTAYLVFDIS